MKKVVLSTLLAGAYLEGAAAFAPSNQCFRPETSLAATNRREVLGNFAKALAAGGLVAAGGTQLVGDSSPQLLAGANPAQWKGGHTKGASFYPGKGMRDHEDQLIAGANPAQWKGGHKKGASFYPGKGMRDHEDQLIA